ncbi:hypothetical protein V2J09_006911 [Rumex salicifolius]
MEFYQNVLNLITIPVIIVLICLVIPPYLIVKVVGFTIRSFFVEDVKGKVVLITGASSGIGEQLAYEYAKKGACLALAARREDRLRKVAEKAAKLGSPDALVLAVDVSIVDHSRRMIKRTIHHFQRVDHIVINAGIGSASSFEDYNDVASMRPIMDVNFWGSVYAAKFAIPHLRKTKGKMIIISSTAWWSPTPHLAFYNASKAAMTSLFETLRVEIGHEIKLTVVIPGFIETEITKKGKSLDENGSLVNNDRIRDSRRMCKGDSEECMQRRYVFDISILDANPLFLQSSLPSSISCYITLVMPFYMVARLVDFLISSFLPEDVHGKVVLITGASSGIGEHVAYEYAKRGACLALAARRLDRLEEVAAKARQLGSPDVIVVTADVSKVHDCERMINQTIAHFHKMDHLVNNAGIFATQFFEDYSDVTITRSIMDVNFWGSVYTTKFAAPHLRRSKGKIVVMASSASWSPTPQMSIYNFRGDIKITLVTPGFIESEVTTHGKTLSTEGDMRDDHKAKNLFHMFPIAKVEGCAQAIVKSVCRGDRYLTKPVWYYYPYTVKLLAPELLDLFFKIVAIDLYNKMK